MGIRGGYFEIGNYEETVSVGMALPISVCVLSLIVWVAVKELKLSSHTRYKQVITMVSPI